MKVPMSSCSCLGLADSVKGGSICCICLVMPSTSLSSFASLSVCMRLAESGMCFALWSEGVHLKVLLFNRMSIFVCVMSCILKLSICLIDHWSLSRTFLPFEIKLHRLLIRLLNALSASLSIITIHNLVAKFGLRLVFALSSLKFSRTRHSDWARVAISVISWGPLCAD